MKRGIEALRSVGIKVARIEIDKDGKITLVPADATPTENQDLRDLV
jgi:hypothetical protein